MNVHVRIVNIIQRVSMICISAIRNKERYTNIMVMHIIGKDNGLYLAICIALKRKLLIVNDWRGEKWMII